jgi:hypothetical protein
MQLPPTLSSFGDETGEEDGLGRTLFVRLASIGYDPVLLRTQYRVIIINHIKLQFELYSVILPLAIFRMNYFMITNC